VRTEEVTSEKSIAATILFDIVPPLIDPLYHRIEIFSTVKAKKELSC